MVGSGAFKYRLLAAGTALMVASVAFAVAFEMGGGADAAAAAPSCSAVSAQAGPSDGSGAMTVTATATCPTGSSPKYAYFVGPSSSGPWTLEAAWIGPSWNWNAAPGEYAVVWVSDGPYTVPQAQTVVALATASAACSAVTAQVVGSTSVTVTSTSTCPAGSSPEYTYFVGPSSSGPWTLEAAWIGPSWTANASPGEYVAVWVSGGPYTVPQAQTIVPLATATSTCSAVSAQVAGSSPVTVTAAGICPVGSSPEYTYFVGPSSSGPWTLEAAWIGPSWTSVASPGEYAAVWVSDGPYTVPQAQTIVPLAADAPATCSAVAAQVTGSSPVTVTATGTCPAGSSPEYTYFVGPSSSGPWTLEAAWIGPSWTANASPGEYVAVWVSGGPYTVPQAQTIVLLVAATATCSAVSAEVSGSGPSTVTAAGTCPAGSSPEYTYFVGPSSSGPWTLEAAWIGPSWTSNASPGEYAAVWVSDGPYTVPQAQTIVPLAADAPATCSAVAAQVTGSSPVTVTATGTCPAGSSPEYTYFVGPSSSGPWTLEAAWIGPSWTSNASPGEYVAVWVSDGPYTVPQAQTIVLLVTATPTCSAVSATTTPAGTAVSGSAVTVNASSVCASTSDVRYSYFVGPTGSGPWTLTAAWVGQSWTWNTAGQVPGTYYIIVWASDGPYTVPQVQTLVAIALTGSSLANPGANITPNFDGTCWDATYSSLVCQQAEVADIDSALASEGTGPLTWPEGLYSLPLSEQEFVVTNEERVLMGLPAIAGMDTAADQNALAGAQAAEDPTIQALPGVIAAEGNWAEDYGALGSDFDWMYNDGPGSFNMDCPAGSNSSLCWAHRDAILANFVSGSLAAPSGYTWVTGDACVADASTTYLSNCDLEYVLIPSGSVTYDFIWTQALADGA